MPARSYPVGAPVHVNVSAFRRQPLFGKAELASIVFELVATHPQTIAACLMPDHLHWLIADAKEMVTCIGRLKSYSTTVAWQQGHGGRLWQRSFWDHVLRKDEDLSRVAQYIIENPVRKGIAQEALSYPYQVLRPHRIHGS
ncbi:MAG: transposase [Thermoanaerobaculia bacterium]